jgi:hypothetical protein
MANRENNTSSFSGAGAASLPVPPSFDIASLTIYDLWCLSDLFDHMAHTSLSFLNQPRFTCKYGDNVHRYTNDLWTHYHALNECLIREVQSRSPADKEEAGWKAEVLLRYFAHGDSYHELLEAVTDVIKTRKQMAMAS